MALHNKTTRNHLQCFDSVVSMDAFENYLARETSEGLVI